MTYTEPMEKYVSARGQATALTVLVLLQLVMLALSAMWWAIGISHLGDDLTGAAAVFGTAMAIQSFDTLLFIAATVVFLTWVHRSIANLPALGSMSCRFTPSGAVWSYFIPIVNLVRGYQVMATIWQESQPPVVSENGFYLPRKATLVNWWWGLNLFTGFVGMVASAGRPHGVAELRSTATTLIVMLVLRIAVGVMFLLMIRGAQSRQDEMWQDLERRRNVPKPTAEALR